MLTVVKVLGKKSMLNDFCTNVLNACILLNEFASPEILLFIEEIK